MMNPSTFHEQERLAALFSYQILDSESETELDDLTELASQICDTPISLISLVDDNRQWFKSKKGLSVSQTSREIAFCAHTIEGAGIFEVTDAKADERFKENPLVTGELNIGFYAGIPLTTPEGYNLGSLCVIDHQPRKLTEKQIKALFTLSKLVITKFELRLQVLQLKKTQELLQARQEQLEHTQQALQESESMYRLISENTNDLIRLYTVDGQYAYVSPSSSSLLGYEPAELMKIEPESSVHPEDLETIIKPNVQQALQGLQPEEYEYRMRHKNGTYVWVETQLKSIQNEQGMVTHLLAVSRDITLRKEALEQLHKSEQRFRVMSEAAPVGILHTSPAGQILYSNPAFERVMGITGTQNIGQSMWRILMPSVQDEFQHEWMDAITSKGYYERTYTRQGINGDEQIIKHKTATIYDGMVPTGHIGIIEDITEQCKALENISALTNKLSGVLDSSLSGIAVFESVRDTKGEIQEMICTLVNKKAMEITKRPESSLLGSNLLSELLTNKVAGLNEHFLRVAEKGEVLDHEYYLANGEEKLWFHVLAVKMGDGLVVTFTDISERKRHEKEISTLTEHLKVQKAALDEVASVVITDANGCITYINNKFSDISGYAVSEMVGNTHQIVNSGYHDTEFFAEMWRTIAAGETWRGEICNRAKDGSYYWVDMTVVPFLNRQGEPYQYLGIRFDITERKRMEAHLKESNRLIEALFDHSPIAIQVYDKEGFSLKMNEAQRSFLGLPSIKYGVGEFNVLHDAYMLETGAAGNFQRAYSGETVALREHLFELGRSSNIWQTDKKSHYYDQIIFPIKNGSNEVEAVVSFSQDTTEAVKVRQELEELNLFNQSIIHSLPNYLYVLSLEPYALLYANEEFCTMLGRPLAELKQLNQEAILKVIHPKDRADLIRYYQTIQQSPHNKVFTTEYRIRNHKGAYRLLSRRDVAFKRNEQGYIVEILGSALDITEAREAEIKLRMRGEELSAMNEIMEQTIEELKTTQGQLIQSEKMASLGQLTAGIAHEINNPINFVYAGVDNLKQSLDELFKLMLAYEKIENMPDSAEQAKAISQAVQLKKALYYEENKTLIGRTLQSIRYGASRTAEIVKGLRNFSRLDEAELKTAHIHEGIDNALILLNHQLKDRIEVVKEYDYAIHATECFPGQLNQVFLNLLSNAIHAIEGKGTIRIVTCNDRDFIHLEISDSGAGIPKEVQKRIFEPFFTTKEVGKGTGLGLSISYGIIGKHQGTISFESTLGQGTTFFIQLPKKILAKSDEAKA